MKFCRTVLVYWTVKIILPVLLLNLVITFTIADSSQNADALIFETEKVGNNANKNSTDLSNRRFGHHPKKFTTTTETISSTTIKTTIKSTTTPKPTEPPDEILPEKCENLQNILTCSGIRDINFVFDKLTESTKSVEITKSYLEAVNLTDFRPIQNLESISITHCKNLTWILGSLPEQIKALNLSSNNNITIISEALFSNSDGLHTTNSQLEILDLSHLSREVLEIPNSTFRHAKLKKLYLAGNQLSKPSCWDSIWEWWKRLVENDDSLLPDAEDTFCSLPITSGKVRYGYSLMAILKAKQELVTACSKVSECSSCSLHGLQKDLGVDYPSSYKGKHGTTHISLAIDCSNRSLTKFPKNMPHQVWELNISHNSITDFSAIKEYKHLKYLDADNNSIKINTLAGSHFISNFSYLSLRYNNIFDIPMTILNEMETVQDRTDHRGVILLGGNYLELCDCELVNFFLKYNSKFKDYKEIYCKNFNRPLLNITQSNACEKITPDQQFWMNMLIVGEVGLIFVIVCKVWFDQRRFRRTGQLPWCSKNIPRLPCDAILESLKYSRRSSQNNSSNTSASIPLNNSSLNSVHPQRNNFSFANRKPIVRFNIKTSRSNSNHSTSLSANSQ